MALGWTEIALLGVLGILIFGKDLPRVTREIGSYFNQLRRSLRGILD